MGLEGDRLQRGAGEVRGGGVKGQAVDGGAGVRVPVRRAHADKGRNQGDAMAVGNPARQAVGVGGVDDDAEAVAQPRDGCTGDEDRAFQRIGDLAAEPVGGRGQQPVGGGDRGLARVEQEKAAGAVGRLGHAGCEAGLADERGLLVADHPADGQLAAEMLGRGHAEEGAGVADLREEGHGHAEQPAEIFVPSLPVDVEQQCAGGVGGVRGVDPAARQAPQEKAVDGAEGEFAALRPGPSAGHVVEHPGDLGGGEIGVEQQAGPGPHQLLRAVGLERGTGVGGAAVLPDDGALDGLAGGAVPQDGGLALVGDADARDAVGREGRAVEGLPADGERVAPDILRIMLDPAGGGIMLGEIAPGGRNRPRLGIEDHRPRGGGALVDRKEVVGGHRRTMRRGRRSCKRARISRRQKWSGREDSNLRPLPPEDSALPG